MNWMGVAVAACLAGSSAVAYDFQQQPILSVIPSFHLSLSRDLEAQTLKTELAAREAEIEALKSRLARHEDEQLYAEAERLGIVAAVRRSKLPAHQQRRLAVAIVREARKNGVDPLLVVAIIRTESAFNNYAVSHVGAMGLMQVMPATGKWLVERRGETLGRTSNLFDSELNVALGTWYIAEMIEQFGTVEKALVAYNAGPGAAKKILARPAIRKRFMAGYPAKVVGEHRKLRAAYERELARRSAAATVEAKADTAG